MKKEDQGISNFEASSNNTSIIKILSEAILENVFVGVVFNIHREITINELVGLNEAVANNIEYQREEGPSIADSLRNKSIECKCFVCNRMIAAVRFAPHLEKCIGIGRTTRTRRRVNNASLNIHNINCSNARTTRSSTLRSAAKTAGNNFEGLIFVNSNSTHENSVEEQFMNNAEVRVQNSLRDRLRNKTELINIVESGFLLTTMKAIIQRVQRASVIVEQQIVSSIGRGICVLVGIGEDDSNEDVEYIVRKLLNLRLFENPETGRRWDKSVKDLGLEVLSVSQFTLHAIIKGNKLDFHRSMSPKDAPDFYLKYINHLKTTYTAERVKDGIFGAKMSVEITNDGPVTISIDSKRRDD